jgi:ferredoxin
MTTGDGEPTRVEGDPGYEPRVDAQRCIGCGLCADMMAEVFALNDDKFGIAYVHDADGWRGTEEGATLLAETADNCPVAAILLHADETVGPGGLPAGPDEDAD